MGAVGVGGGGLGMGTAVPDEETAFAKSEGGEDLELHHRM